MATKVGRKSTESRPKVDMVMKAGLNGKKHLALARQLRSMIVDSNTASQEVADLVTHFQKYGENYIISQEQMVRLSKYLISLQRSISNAQEVAMQVQDLITSNGGSHE